MCTNCVKLYNKTSRQCYVIAAFSPDWWMLVSNVDSVLSAHRQNLILTPLLTLIQPRVEGGKLAYDFTNFDRWVETFKQAGAIGYIEGNHLLARAGSYDAPQIGRASCRERVSLEVEGVSDEENRERGEKNK